MKYRIETSIDHKGKIWYQPQRQILWKWYSYEGTFVNRYSESYSTEEDALSKIEQWKEELLEKKWKPIRNYKYIK